MVRKRAERGMEREREVNNNFGVCILSNWKVGDAVVEMGKIVGAEGLWGTVCSLALNVISFRCL